MSAALPLRAGSILLEDLIDLYMRHYAGRDSTRTQRLSWWQTQAGDLSLAELSDDHVHAALETLKGQRVRYFAGKDADGKPILKAKRQTLAPATLNRYGAALAAVITWAIKKRIAPKGYVHPCRSIEREVENNQKTRFLDEGEQTRLLEACRVSTWPRLYVLVLMALTTGARKGELLGLRWADVDLERGLATVPTTKNGDAKVLPLTSAVVEELRNFAEEPTRFVFRAPRAKESTFAFEPRYIEALKLAGIRGCTFHTLRHSCASRLAKNGATLLEIADLLGHRQLQMTKRYSHLATSHKAALVNRVLGGIQ